VFAIEMHSKGATHLAGRGNYLSDENIRQIVQLLSSTELTVSEIGERMSCSKSAILAINRKFKVRIYDGLRSRWSAGAPEVGKKKSA
jgi:hypothetical protein